MLAGAAATPSIESLLDDVVPRPAAPVARNAQPLSEPDPVFLEGLLRPQVLAPASVSPESALAPAGSDSPRASGAAGPRLAPALPEEIESLSPPREEDVDSFSTAHGTSRLERPLLLTVVAGLDGLAAFCLLGIAGILAIAGATAGWNVSLVLIGILFVALSAASAAAVVGVLTLRPWGRSLQIALAGVGLLVLPVGTVLGGLLLYYLFQPGMRILFSGRKPEELSPAEAASVVRVSGGQAGVVALVTVAVVLIGTFFVGIIAAIAIPSLLRARVAANEASAVARARELVSAQTMYATSNGGFYGSPECLAAPETCIPGYSGLPFYEASPDETGQGYRARIHLGPPPPPEVLERGRGTIAPSSVVAFSYVLTPVAPGKTGTRTFCADHRGLVCWVSGAIAPPSDGEGCPMECNPIP